MYNAYKELDEEKSELEADMEEIAGDLNNTTITFTDEERQELLISITEKKLRVREI